MAQFPTAGHLASWAGLCPGNDESAGKRRSGKTTKGSQWLRTTLVQAAWAASHTKKTIFSACYHSWAKRLGRKKALVAVAHKMLVVIYLSAQEPHRLPRATGRPQGCVSPWLGPERGIFRGTQRAFSKWWPISGFDRN